MSAQFIKLDSSDIININMIIRIREINHYTSDKGDKTYTHRARLLASNEHYNDLTDHDVDRILAQSASATRTSIF